MCSEKTSHIEDRWRFSLRSLLVMMMVAGVLFAIARSWPHVVVFVIGIAPAALFTWILIHRVVVRKKVTRLLVLGTCLAWIALYAASGGPVSRLVDQFHINRASAMRFYAPVLWVRKTAGLEKISQWYVNRWQGDS
jgi:hypothetical protein